LVTLRRYCVHSTLVPVVVPIFFSRTIKKSMKELLLSSGKVLDGKRGGTRLAKLPHPEVCSFFFLQISPPLCLSVFCFGALNFFVLRGYCSAGPRQLGTESNRALCPASVSCVCHVLIPNISLLFPFSSRQSGKGQQTHEHLHHSVCLPVLHAPPLCPMFPNASLFFSAPPPHGPLF
jgi:hypothetical protein